MEKIDVKVEIDIDDEDDECCMFRPKRKCKWLRNKVGVIECILFDNELRINEDGYPLRCDDCWFRIT